jgi:hypothetical protein
VTASLQRALIACMAMVLVLGASGQAAAKYEIELERGSFVPAIGLLARDGDSHLVVQFYEVPSLAEREELRAQGITLLDYIPNYAWTASVRGGAVRALDARSVRAVFALAPGDKISPRAENRELVRAFTYSDVIDAEGILGKYGRIVSRAYNAYTLELSGDLRDLAAEDVVQYVDGPLPEKELNNDVLRANIHANEVQAAPYGLSGLGLTVGMWDGGTVATNHDDFAGRLTIADGAPTASHATKCAGIMAGDGSRSAYYGGTPNQWRGVATEVEIASYDWPADIPDMDNEYADALTSYGIIVSSNSWGWGLCPNDCGYFGTYDDWSQNFDKIVSGSQGERLSIVFSAGNSGNCSACSGSLPDFPYGTIPGPGSTAKNTIVVGSNNADDDALSYYSSRGPTGDGRIKPDLVAPGCKSYAGITTTSTNNDYNSSSCGTSFSCPAVSGSAVLTQQDFIDKFGVEALPSTVKALLIQGAEDQGNTGPDYEFGFGRVNIQNTIDVIRTDGGTGDLIKEGTLSTGGVFTHNVEVAAESELKVTLVWDDYYGNYQGSGRMLVNDLDLELVSPGSVTYHPWLLDPDNPSAVATTGVDSLNNVEQVLVSSPQSGVWTIRVIATLLPQPGQDFSLVTNVGAPPDVAPSAPTGLGAAPGPGEGEIQLTWSANTEPDLDHYRLERDTTAVFGAGAVSFETASESYLDGGLELGRTYYYRLFAVDLAANESAPSDTVQQALESSDVPESTVASVSLIRPNPFTREASIAYTVPSRGAAVTIRIYDVSGRLVRTVADARQDGGSYTVSWDGRDWANRAVSPGIYFCHAAIGDWIQVRKVVFLK